MGTFAYHTLEKWNYVDSLYFSTTTLLTVGFGDLHPTSSASKLFTVFYMISGVSVGLIALTAIASYLFENQYAPAYNSTKKAIKESIAESMRRRRYKL